MALDTEIWAKSLLSGTSAKKLSRESHWPVLGTEQKPVWQEPGWQGRERQEVVVRAVSRATSSWKVMSALVQSLHCTLMEMGFKQKSDTL